MCSLLCSPMIPPDLCMCECGAAGLLVVSRLPRSSHNLILWVRLCCSESCPPGCLSPPRLPISDLPTGLDVCFFFISLVVGLLCSSIFCQFWLFFVFKLLLSFWLCKEVQCVYLRLHLGFSPNNLILKEVETELVVKVTFSFLI